jgi:hypothetical protein
MHRKRDGEGLEKETPRESRDTCAYAAYQGQKSERSKWQGQNIFLCLSYVKCIYANDH